MKFSDRLQVALSGGVLVEMASFSLPQPIPLPNRYGDIILVKYLDMRWEDYKNPLIKRWGQWTPFTAELPSAEGYRKRFLIWDGATAHIKDHEDRHYYTAPKGWWGMAQGMDEKGQEVMAPKVRRPVEKWSATPPATEPS